ncbi:unnamed protein product, partial [Owenia fusiformis]
MDFTSTRCVILVFTIMFGFDIATSQLCSRLSTTLQNGSVNPKCSKKGCSQMTVKCSSCHRLVGPKKIKCIKGRWAPLKSTCIRIFCERPKLGANTIVSSNSTKCGTVLEVKCAAGYGSSQTSKMLCKPSKKWKGQPLTCSRIDDTCSDLTIPENALLVAGRLGKNKAGETVTFQCNNHYKSFGKRTLTCLDGGKWSGLPIMCKLGGRCPDISIGENNGLEVIEGKTSNNIYGDRIRFRCRLGLILTGRPEIKCRWDGFWTLETPICIKQNITHCPALSSPEHGFVAEGKTTNNKLGDSVTFACDQGYTLDGTPTLTCFKRYSLALPGNFTDGLVWDIAMPVCRTSDTGDCPDLVLPKYGQLIGASRLTGNEVGDRIIGGCRKPYIKQGERVLECLRNGIWNKPIFSCHASNATCPDVILEKESNLVVLRGKLVGNVFYDRIIFGCKPGYKIIDSYYYMVCDNTGGWSQQIPICTDCTKPCPPGKILDERCTTCICPFINIFVYNTKMVPIDGVTVSRAGTPVDEELGQTKNGLINIKACPSDKLVFKKTKYVDVNIIVESDRAEPNNVIIESMEYPEIVEHPQDIYAVIGDSIHFKCRAIGKPRPETYQWYKNGKILPDSKHTSQNLLIENVKIEDKGTFHCKASSKYGSTASDPADLDVK